ncbi:redoxin domain protein [Lanmaoa asiatica]|nr:redoxin domain protein [Lanmaoa asiatica]
MATESVPADWSALPSDLPMPMDDGEADHLASRVELPESVLLRATETSPVEGQRNGNGETVVDLRALSFEGPVLVFVYPRTGKPGMANPPGWDAIPGARGCTPELCAVRDTLDALQAARPGSGGPVRIFGLSTQSPEYQSEVATRLGLPYPILSDETRVFSEALRLPKFEVEGMVLLKRITLLMYEGKVIGRDYPVFPSDRAASRALDLLRLL